MANEALGMVLRRLRRWVGGGVAEDESDAQLLERFGTRQDEAAFATLMQRHGPLVLSVCRRMLADPHDVDDAFQATFVVLVRRAAALRREGSLGSWLYGVAYRIALKARARGARRRAREPQAEAMSHEPLSPVAENDPLNQVALREVGGVLDDEVNQLPAKYRGPLILCYLEGKTNEEAAKELGCPIGSMSWKLDKGRELLRSRLARRGVALSVGGVATALGEHAATAAVPAGLGDATLRTAMLLAGGKLTAAVVSAEVATLAESFLRGVVAAKLRVAALVVLTFSLLGGGSVFAYRTWVQDKDSAISPQELAGWVERRVAELQPTKDDRKIDQIGWAADIRDALRLARETNRPVFLFTHDGRINTGRCGGSAFNLRGHSFADDRVIALLNRSFVPVYSSNQDTGKDGTAPIGEKEERWRIYHATHDAKMHIGDDCIYILTPDGRPFDSLSIRQAKQTDVLLERLEQDVQKLGTPSGPPVVLPKPQMVPPATEPDSLVLHLTARVLNRNVWCEFPAENWIVLSRHEWTNLAPMPALHTGKSYDIPTEVATRLLTHCYPQTENNDIATNRIDRAVLRGVVWQVTGGVAHVRLDGSLRMKHRFYPTREDDNMVDTTLTGFLEVDLARGSIRSLRLVTDRATYGPWEFAVALRSLP
ncbi:hypothetical protein AYO44_02150 [Planctomycetaceae bacterium SCGC AG-212-F19]|nr:hypothetical protein AYO44_02150 [Planctomycetaceae bacterium SCGC AG-212-F19]